MLADRAKVDSFTSFVRDVEPRLRHSLIPSVGVDAATEATAEALAYGWEHWDRLRHMDNPAGYLYRVARTKVQPIRNRIAVFPGVSVTRLPHVEPGLPKALQRLSEKQRTVVWLVHGLEWRQKEVADLLGVLDSLGPVACFRLYILRCMDEATPSKPRRATGLSLAAIILLSAAFVAVLALHLLRTDLSPVREVMSGYANGPSGNVMTFAFYALGFGSIAIGFRLTRSTTRTWVPRTVSTALVVAGATLILAGVFEVERPGVPDTVQESIHSNGAIAGFVVIVAAMVVFPYICSNDARWRQLLVPCLICAMLAVGAAAFSPVAPNTTIAGLAQRALAIVVFGWVLLIAAWMRFGSAEDSKLGTGPK